MLTAAGFWAGNCFRFNPKGKCRLNLFDCETFGRISLISRAKWRYNVRRLGQALQLIDVARRNSTLCAI
jgi:hypothetical protein